MKIRAFQFSLAIFCGAAICISAPAIAAGAGGSSAAGAEAPAGAAASPRTPLFEGAPTIAGIAVADLDRAIAGAAVFRAAQEERSRTFKTAIEAAEARRSKLKADLEPLVAAYNRDLAATKPDQALLARELRAARDVEAAGDAEIRTIVMPIAMSEAYGMEQIKVHLLHAAEQAMAKHSISWLGGMNSLILGKSAYDLTPAISAELDSLLPSIAIVPPADWKPPTASATDLDAANSGGSRSQP